MKYIWQYIRRYPKWLLLNITGAIIFALVNLGLPTVMGYIIDDVLVAGNKDSLWFWFWLAVGLSIVGMGGRILLSYASSKMTTEMIREMRNDLYRKIQTFSHQEYDQIGVSSLVTRITNDAFVLMQFTDQALRIGFITPIMMVFSFGMIFVTQPSLSWTVAGAIPFLILIIYRITQKSRPLSERQQTTLDKINQYARENLTGLRVIRAFTREELQEERFNTVNDQYTQTSDRLFKLMGSAFPLFLHVFIWSLCFIVWFGLDPISRGEMAIGNMSAFIEYTFHALYSFMLFSNLFMMFPRMMVSANRLVEIMELPISIDPNVDGVTQTDRHGEIEFDNVTFAYPGEVENAVLSNISFKANPGEIVAFIGSTGSGKSTLVQLIPRFYDVTEGRVLVDGVDVRDYNLQALREKIGFIPQKALLFTGTIGDNLRYGKYNATEHELERASDISQASEFIRQQKDRFQAHLAEGGSNLSGGQKQRLSIARAVIKEAEIYIFDDSFSALDYQTDAQLRRRLREETSDATTLIVAQRVSSIMNADLILVLDKGEIVGRGTHEELLANNTIYRDIAESQLKPSELAKGDDLNE